VSVFKNGPVASILVQNFFFGITFYGYLYYLPLYYQNVKQYSVLKSALLTIPLTTAQSIASICSGQYISRMKRYGECIVVGFTLLTIATSLTTIFNRTTPVWANVIILLVMGIGNGNVFQPTIISLQAHSPKAQRAVIISIRNFLRCLGGAVGLAVSAAILQNVLRSSLPPQFQDLAHSTYAKPNYTLYSPEDAEVIMNAYEKASHTVFVFYAPVTAICLVCCVFVKDRGLQRQEDVDEELRQKEEAEHAAREANMIMEVSGGELEMGRSVLSFESHEKLGHRDVDTSTSKLSLPDSQHEKPKQAL
jgi:MFS family permease